MLDSIFSRALGRIQQIAGEPIEIRREGVPARASAVCGSTTFRYDTMERPSVVERSIDFLIPVQLYQFDGLTQLPKEDDLIVRVLDGRRHIHQVVKFNGEPCWRWADPRQTELRVHTRFVRIEG